MSIHSTKQLGTLKLKSGNLVVNSAKIGSNKELADLQNSLELEKDCYDNNQVLFRTLSYELVKPKKPFNE